MNNISYIIPNKKKIGGIQSLAFSIHDYLVQKQKLAIEVFDYQYDVPLLHSLTVKVSPSFTKKILAKKLIFSHFDHKYHPVSKKNIVHCWHLDAAIFFLSHPKLIITVHGHELTSESLGASWYRRTYYQHALTHAQRIICDSSYTKQLLLKTFDVKTNKISVIYPPIEVEKFVIKKSNKPKKQFVIGTLCRFVERKNVSTVIEALNILHQSFPNFSFQLAGDGPQKKLLLKKLANVHFSWNYHGKISDEEKTQTFYPNLDVFVMPTLESKHDVEGFGIVYLEANASGVPVISAKSGGAKEALLENISGLFADPKNPEDIAKKIKRILESKKYTTKTILAWAKQFDVAISGQEYQKIYAQFI